MSVLANNLAGNIGELAGKRNGPFPALVEAGLTFALRGDFQFIACEVSEAIRHWPSLFTSPSVTRALPVMRAADLSFDI